MPPIMWSHKSQNSLQDKTVFMVEMCLWALMDSDNDNDGDDKNIVGPNQWKGVGSALG